VGRDASTLAKGRREERAAAAPRSGPLRVGVVGLGAVAQAVHLPLLAKHPKLFRIAAVCDLSRGTCAALGDRFGIDGASRYDSAQALLAGADLDALAILTPGSHGELAVAAARRGIHAIFCEKPLAYTLAEADELAALGARLQLGYMKLYDPAVERARELLADRPSPRSIEVTVLHPPDAPQLAHAGLLERSSDVDAAVLADLEGAEEDAISRALGDVPRDLGRVYADVVLGSIVHDLAVIRYLVGGPLELEYADRWETSVALAGTIGGVRVSIHWHYLDGYPAYREEVHVHDAGGTVSLTFPAPYLLHAPTVVRVVEGGGSGAERVSETRSTVEAFERQWLAFASFARDGVRPRAGIAEGREDIVTCQSAAALLAAREGLAVGGEAAATVRTSKDGVEHGKGGAR